VRGTISKSFCFFFQKEALPCFHPPPNAVISVTAAVSCDCLIDSADCCAANCVFWAVMTAV
jgi:hypothetical protein